MKPRLNRATRTLSVLAALLLGGAQLHGQLRDAWDKFSNPKVEIPITHPPAFPLKINRVAFEDPKGPCSEELYDIVESAFIENNIEVLNRSHLDAVLREQGFGVSGLARQETAVAVGNLLGAQALVFLKVTTCKTTPLTEKKSKFVPGRGNVEVHLYVTKADFRGSVRVIDLTSGRTLKTKQFQATLSMSDEDGHPDGDGVLQQAKDLGAGQIRRLFFPWSETRELVFYEDDDKFCNLEPGFNSLRAGDLEGALTAAEVAYEHCRDTPGAKPKMIGRAAYDLGVVQCLRADFDAGLSTLAEALRLNGGDVVASAIAECRKAKEAASGMDIYETDLAAVQADLSAIGDSGGRETEQQAGSRSSEPGASRPTQGSVEDRLRTLQDLRKKGLIDEKEFQNRKAEILNDL